MDRHGGLALTRRATGVLSETDAWSREARQVREQATRLGLTLDDEELALQDVRDLQALHASLHARRTGHTGPRGRGLQGLWAQVRVRATGAAAAMARRS